MPIIPSVFQPVRANDVHQRPFKAYKNYKVTKATVNNTTASGYYEHNAIYKKHTPHVGISTYTYPTNFDDTNKHVVWNTIDARYYRFGNDPARSFDFGILDKTTRFLNHSASILTAPYFEVGEKIKPGSVYITGSIGKAHEIRLNDDAEGNLVDRAIQTGSFASSSNCIFHLSFNNAFRKFEDIDDARREGLKYNETPGQFEYKLGKSKRHDARISNVKFEDGVEANGVYAGTKHHGLSAQFGSISSSIRIPYNDKFNRFGLCDDWTISFFISASLTANSNTGMDFPIITKVGTGREQYFDNVSKQKKIRDFAHNMPSITASFAKTKTPMVIGWVNNAKSASYHFHSSDGTKEIHISSSFAHHVQTDKWKHVAIRNSASLCQIFIDGVSNGTSGSLPEFPNINAADIMIGAFPSGSRKGIPSAPSSNNPYALSEVRMYDYAVNEIGLKSLANRNYLSASLFQTDVVGNVFYKNGQFVVSSPHPKFDSGSGFFNHSDWVVRYKGTHTIYENQVMVRVPKDQFNVTMNPTATYRPATVGEVCTTTNGMIKPNVPSGELRKPLFVSGTLMPYVTTIGLYNDKAQMMGIGKLAQPIQKRPDVDMHFVVRWDY